MLTCKNYCTGLIVSLSCISLTFAEVLEDPRTRDEDLSNTRISSSYRVLPNGMYEYLYNIESPLTNKGEISTFRLDISCDITFPLAEFTEAARDSFTNSSKDGKHVPILADGVMYFTGLFGISVRNHLYWGVGIKPGDIAKGYRVISPVAPGKIRYALIPVMHVDGWDYLSFDENDPSVPWIPDFTVSGMIDGPACPSDTSAFPGSNKNEKESLAVNNLLSYSSPIRDRFHVESGTKNVSLTINYGKDIDPKSFKVEPAYLKHYFQPTPGKSEKILLPLKNNDKTKIKLSVRPILEGENQKGKKTNKITNPAWGRSTDYDEFEIRKIK